VLGHRVPHSVTPGPPAHATVQVTPLSAGSLDTVATNCVVVPKGTTVAPSAWTETVMAVTATVVEADFVGSLCDVAVIVTVIWPGGEDAGAVYVVGTSLAVVAGETVPHGAAEHDTVQDTPRLA